jgi:hypothetical protein
MNQTGKVFFACALGAFVGALVALQINHNFWWVGLLAGFSVGYLTYEFKKITTAVPEAWNATISFRWHLNKEWWRWYPKAFAAGASLGTVAALPMLVVALVLHSKVGLYCSLEMIIMPAVMLAPNVIKLEDHDATQEKVNQFLRANGVRVWGWIVPKGILGGVWRILCLIPASAFAIGRFFQYLFKLTHTEIRLLCGVDAAIGAAIGFYFHNAFIGAIVGGLWGVMNFELFSIRLLKLVPQERSFFRR